jgi:hypothetical protein
MPNPLRLENLSLDDSHPAPLETAKGEREPVHLHMLSFVFKDGRRTAFDYAHLYRIDYDGIGEIRLQFAEHTVTLQGDLLEHTYDCLVLHTVTNLVELDDLHRCPSPDGLSVRQISVADLV